jgi:ABC-2 type transport system ATP-binding protein
MIQVRNVSKSYQIVEKDPGLLGSLKALFVRRTRTHHAVKSIDFEIKQGEMVAYIGANGAGKSTTIKLLCGILTPGEGEVRIHGIEPSKERMQNAKMIGAVFGQRSQLLWDLPVRESFELLKHIYEVPEQPFREMLNRCIDVLQLEPLLGMPVRQLSLGQKMRCELAAAFLHRPKIVYLDEPTIGLDVAVKARIRTFIKEMNRMEQTTIILTSHDMQDIEALCDRVMIIDQGTLVYDGQLDKLKSDYGQQRVVVFHCDPTVQWRMPAQLEGRVSMKVVDPLIEPGVMELGFDRESFTATEIIAAVMSCNSVHDLTVRESGIEAIVKAIYERNGG